MNVSEAIKARRTIRAFTAEPLPEPVIREVLELARHAPSTSNTRPWRIGVVTGNVRQRLQDAIFEEINSPDAKMGREPVDAFASISN